MLMADHLMATPMTMMASTHHTAESCCTTGMTDTPAQDNSSTPHHPTTPTTTQPVTQSQVDPIPACQECPVILATQDQSADFAVRTLSGISVPFVPLLALPTHSLLEASPPQLKPSHSDARQLLVLSDALSLHGQHTLLTV